MSTIQAITFDLWDTVIADDSDEPKRSAQGLPTKREQRRILVQQFLERHEPIACELVNAAYDTTDAAFHFCWYDQDVTWTVRERLAILLEGLGRTLPDDELAELVRLHEEMELLVKPEPIPGIREALEALKGKHKLGVISDAIFSPGRALRELLEYYDLHAYFDHFVFSDEVGRSKPHPRVFEEAARGLGVEVSGLVHIGDRETKDVDGPRRVGARSILFRGDKGRDNTETRADAVCDDYGDLANILERLDSRTES